MQTRVAQDMQHAWVSLLKPEICHGRYTTGQNPSQSWHRRNTGLRRAPRSPGQASEPSNRHRQITRATDETHIYKYNIYNNIKHIHCWLTQKNLESVTQDYSRLLKILVKMAKIDKFRVKITLKLAQIDALDDLLDLYLSGKSEMKI